MTVLERLSELGASYQPHTYDSVIDLNPLLQASSSGARVFFQFANDEKGPQLAVDSLYEPAWPDDPDLVRYFERLEPEQQVEVLTLYTVPLHETRHHLDFSATPFGARFFIGLALEYTAFQRFSPFLLQNQHLIPRGTLRRLDTHLHSLGEAVPDEWRADWDVFEQTLLAFEATTDFRGIDVRSVSFTETTDDMPFMAIIDRDHRLLQVAGNVTLSPVDRPDWYMRASTVLEGRAVVESLRWVLSALAGSTARRSALHAYVDENYPAEGAYDYRYFLDLAAAWMGQPTIERCIDDADLDTLDQVLWLLDLAGWFALHARIRDDHGRFVSEPMFVRFAYAVQEMDREYSRAEPRHPFELLSAVEQAERARALQLTTLGDSLEGTRAAVSTVLDRHVAEIWQQEMRQHFETVLGVLDSALERRQQTGYASPLSSPPDGNPFAVFDPADAGLFAEYTPSPWVGRWFELRNGAVFRPDTLRRVRAQLADQFGLAELVVPCECGTLISAVVPKWRPQHEITCHCGKVHSLSAGDLNYITVPEDVDEELAASFPADAPSGEGEDDMGDTG